VDFAVKNKSRGLDKVYLSASNHKTAKLVIAGPFI
jgi:hypothetical protein